MRGTSHSIAGAFTSTLEAILLVFLGIMAANVGNAWSLIVIALIFVSLVVIRYLAGARARQDESRAWFHEYIQDTSNLESIIRGISQRGLKESWSKRDLIIAIKWWYEEDLQNDWTWNEYLEEKGLAESDSPEGFVRASRGLLSWLRHPGRHAQIALLRLERRFLPPADRLIFAVADLPFEEIARAVIKQGVEKKLIYEEIDRREDGNPRVTYSILRLPDVTTTI